MKTKTLVLTALVAVAINSPAFAHPNHALPSGSGFQAGFAHPWFGLDHLLAMIAVGLLSVRIGGAAIWVLPFSFLGFLAVGGAFGMAGLDLQVVEMGIALSVVILGASLAAGKRYRMIASAIAIGGMGLLHGHAHGTEMPVMATPALYALGFVTATALLHVLGITAGKWFTQTERRIVMLRISGAAISFTGAVLLIGAF